MGLLGIDFERWRKDGPSATIPMLSKTPRETIDDLLFLAYKCRQRRFEERRQSAYNSQIEDDIDGLIVSYLDEPGEPLLEEIKAFLRQWI